ncbi:site-specific integrase [Schinkia azotoformans]|uniref:Tyrosine recombinase XerC n=1 Tax=Schinkia azotoformans LMG 9581 TaxID=1131731 RepID=K6DI84_SCHAZ|nr:site-specific integrase [Schinkia azotoformans]EKN67833.1 tyrosine recombinase XerC [Schinkia azotoformans LMG 9581]MEC1637402.1 site-specific integrase [Schinkia azotoformans]MEC1943806.1 site-specific integrase [Schinkia azotoformans]
MASFRKRGCTCEKKKCTCGAKWEYRIKYVDRQTGKTKEKSKGGFTSKKEAQLAAAEEELKINQFGFAENGNEVVLNYFSEWLEVFKKPNVKPITYSVQERNVRLNILPRWGKYRLKDITRTEYQKWINELRDHYSEGTVRRIHSIFSSAIHDAVHEFHIIRENPIQKIKIPKDVENTNRVQYFSKEQLEKFLNSLKTPQKNAKYKHSIQYYVLFSLMARTGIRIGEALALTWDDFNEKEKSISITKTLVYPLNSTPYISTPKSLKSVRIVKLDEQTVKLLKKHKINQNEVILRYKNYKASKDNVMFHQHDGRWLRTNVVREYFKEVCKRTDLPVLSPHALRHSHAVHLLEAGANIKYVSERLGHASTKVTADTYLHITEKIENEALELYSQYIKF